ncbi:MAG: class I SAM-dependent methyltransferase [candidate division Zixibacteria bacterium]|nr:class I SAM-dependent methyltransferase [candidate division Zixibacteria bacterium]
MLDLLGPDMSLLDVGCGRTFPMAEKWLSTDARVCGIDPVADQSAAPKGAEVIEGGSEEMPFGDQEFDVITSCAVLEHLEKPAKVFQEFHRVLKAGGRAVLLTPSKYDYVSVAAKLMPNRFHAKVVSATEGRDEMDTFPTFYRANSHRQLMRLAANAGLKLQKFEYLDQSPYAFRFSPVLYWIAYRYHEFVRSVRCLNFLNGWILCVLTKPNGQMKASMRYNG